jgi:O-antigen ligase
MSSRRGILGLLAIVLVSGTALAAIDPEYRRDRHAELLTLLAGGLLGALTPGQRGVGSWQQGDGTPESKD